ncbi:threonine ammonia-lyase [Parasphaerochaeta coccoides]|uniref:L-threonine ammonia-lyase n=1 Tax=Parasphaerochaeta coccoides (strain ATCC BAA-1237 / DSM 17374 / SPN1) TaxID=760011 RepID=F4GJS2_PARC1|nr:threonine ammonia-lyase [Parasphaerochaeta coccoides]AEC02819.1 L-threonine ammonia-lyase [Parasphaerochaeta coccoides DSM 17374]
MTIDKIYHAKRILDPVVRRTDLIRAPRIFPDSSVFLKTENLQITGSFKVRGAYYKISQLPSDLRQKGVIACSAGNHAQGVALAAQHEGLKAVICIPDVAPISKVEATRAYGADVRLVPGVYDDAYQEALRLQRENGGVFIHPFDDEDIIAGQGSIGLEILEQLPDVDSVIVPVGGGGLISGIAYAIKALKPECAVYGVQVAGAASMYDSLEQHQKITLGKVSTMADGIAVKHPGDLTYEMCATYVDKIVTVTDDEVSSAILALMEKQKLVTEGAGAVAVAAAMFHKIEIEGRTTVCLLSGGNIDVTILSRVISRGLLKSGRSTEFTIELLDKPGQLVDVSAIIARQGGNVVAVHHDRSGEGTDLNSCTLRLALETKDFDHIRAIRRALGDAGFKFV